MHLVQLDVPTRKKEQFIDITAQVARLVKETGFKNGFITLFVPHTTAAVTINESADPAVVEDIISVLHRLIPQHGEYHHHEGNSAAHIKSSLVGCSQELLLKDGVLLLGTWQGIFFCEFDGPRTRKLLVGIAPC
ncbi:MAG: YjbQ family protein [Candidatus Cloacimonetes bacterium]|nr:YjbQ family protein [Candidatus Cloacimonadota bacterium]